MTLLMSYVSPGLTLCCVLLAVLICCINLLICLPCSLNLLLCSAMYLYPLRHTLVVYCSPSSSWHFVRAFEIYSWFWNMASVIFGAVTSITGVRMYTGHNPRLWPVEIDGWIQACSNSIAKTLKLLQYCTKPSKSAGRSWMFIDETLPSTSELNDIDMGQGLIKQISPFRYFPCSSDIPKHWLPTQYHVHVWQASPQLRWHLSNMNVIKNLAYTLASSKFPAREKSTNRGLVNSTPGLLPSLANNDNNIANIKAPVTWSFVRGIYLWPVDSPRIS